MNIDSDNFLIMLLFIIIITYALLWSKHNIEMSVFKPWPQIEETAWMHEHNISFEFLPMLLSSEIVNICIYTFRPKIQPNLPTDLNNTNENKIIMFCHGNEYNMGFYRYHCQAIADTTGINVIAFDYPGYGLSSGQPNMNNIHYAASFVLNHIIQKHNITNLHNNICLYGLSLGSHIASWVAHIRRDIRYLILDAAFPSISHAARNNFNGMLAPLGLIAAFTLYGLSDITSRIVSLSSICHITAIRRSYDTICTNEQFVTYIKPYVHHVETIDIGHAWPIHDINIISRIFIPFKTTNKKRSK